LGAMVAPEDLATMPWWWVVLLSACTVAAMLMALVVPVVTTVVMYRGKRDGTKSRIRQTARRSSSKTTGPPSFLELRDWRQASELAGCPWSFEGCEGLMDVLERIWHPLPAEELQPVLEAIRARVQGVRVVRIARQAQQESHFGIVYTLMGGAELFGGAPLQAVAEGTAESEAEVGAGASEAAASEDEGGDAEGGAGGDGRLALRAVLSSGSQPSHKVVPRRLGARLRRRGPAEGDNDSPELPALPLPCLSPFYRVHDGFAALLSTLDLPALLRRPDNMVRGSCFYVYPTSAMRPIARWPNLVKFARVDRQCVASASRLQERPGLVYVERTGSHIADDYPPLAFVADTISNVISRAVAQEQEETWTV